MAVWKKNQMNQILFTMVDKTDFATIESGLTSNFTVSVFGVDNGGSAAASDVTLSKAVSVVKSGVYKITAKAAETNFDFIMLKITHASAADQMIPIQCVGYDTTDISDMVSKVASLVWAYDQASQASSGMGSTLQSLLANITPGEIASAVWDATTTAHSDVGSFGSYLETIHSDVSNILVDTAGISTVSLAVASVASDVWSKFQSLTGSTASDVASGITVLTTRVPDHVASLVWDAATASYSDVGSFGSYLETVHSDVSNILVDTAGISTISLAVASLASNVWSQDKSNFQVSSTMGSVLQAGTATPSAIADKVWSDFQSKTGSTISDIASGITILTTRVSDNVASMVWDAATASYSDIGSFGSYLETIHSDVSNILVDTAGISTVSLAVASLASDVWSQDKSNFQVSSTMGSVLQAGTASPSAVADKVWSDFQSKVGSSISNVVADITAIVGDTPGISTISLAVASLASNVWSQDKSNFQVSSTLGSVLQAIPTDNDKASVVSAVWAADPSTISGVAGSIGSLLVKEVDDITTTGVQLAASQAAAWASSLEASAGQILERTVDTVTNTHTPTTAEFQADDETEATTDHYNGRVVIFTSGACAGQASDITAYSLVGGIGQFTVTAMTDAPANNDTFVIV